MEKYRLVSFVGSFIKEKKKLYKKDIQVNF